MKCLQDFILECLNEDAKPKQTVNIIVGRFQPFTLGHVACVKQAVKDVGENTVLCVVDTTKADDKHPFLTSEMTDILDKIVMYEKNVVGWVRVKNADIVKNAEILREAGYNPVSWTCGTDRYDSYSRMATKYADMAGLTEDFKVIEVKRGDDDISATKVRTALKEGDRKAFEASMPVYLHSSFDEMKKMIDK